MQLSEQSLEALRPHIPTGITIAEVEALQELARGRDVIEIASLFGFSTIALSRVARYVWAIDLHEGYPHAKAAPTLEIFFENLRRFGRPDRVVPMIAPAENVLPRLRGASFGLIFIDHADSAKELIFEANNLDPLYIALHDYDHPI